MENRMATGQPKARNRKLPAGNSGALLGFSATKRINTRSTLQLGGMEAATPLVHSLGRNSLQRICGFFAYCAHLLSDGA
jgi:hypothetical protein